MVPLVSVVIPARNEEEWIETCLGHVVAQDYPSDRLEVIVVDGASTDATVDRARRALQRAGLRRVEILANPARTTPAALNIGLAAAQGDILCRVDARSLVESHHVAVCVEVLTSGDEVAVVGGRQRAVPRDSSSRAIGIARALNNRWATGFARYRRGGPSGPTDTVYLGAFRTAQLRAAAGWDEIWTTNQDFELNRRLAATGYVWFDARLSTGYVPRGDFASLWRQYVRFGRAKAAYWRSTGDRPRPRQLVLAVGPLMSAAAAVVAMCASPRARWGVPVLATAGLAGVETVGSDEPRGSLAAHVMAAAAIVTVGAGWTVGLYGGLLRRGNRS